MIWLTDGQVYDVERGAFRRADIAIDGARIAELVDRANIRIQIWERGAGHTLASGSSASAAACAAHRLGQCDARVRVHMPGGVLEIEIEPDFAVAQTGPVAQVARGALSPEALADGLPWPSAR